MTARRALVGLGLAAAAAWSAGCGNKGPPIPPLPSRPETPRSVVWRVRGDALEMEAVLSLSRLGGRRIRPPVHVTLLWAPAGERGRASVFGRAEAFVQSARAVALDEIRPADGGEAAAPAPIRVTWRGAFPLGRFEGKPRVVVALALTDRGASSYPTERVLLEPPAEPLPPLESFTAEPTPEGMRLAWGPNAGAAGERVRIYRARDGEPAPWKVWRDVPRADGSIVDDSVAYGETWRYEACAALARTAGSVPIESVPRVAGPLLYEDSFPPLPPRDVAGVPLSGAIRVGWTPGGSPDEARAHVERQARPAGAEVEGASDWVEVGVVALPESWYVDAEVETGWEYRYRVQVEDTSGNRAPPSAPTDWIAPRPPREEGRS